MGSRLLRIIGEINYDSFSAFSEQLAELEGLSSAPVQVELCSEGGTDYAGLAFWGRIRNSPCRIEICAIGAVQSAATLVFAAGDYRMAVR